MSRRFVLRREIDISGVSGEGDVAEGVQWSDGTVALRWRGRWPATTVWEHGMDALIAVHGHSGKTTVEWADLPPATAWDMHDDPTVDQP